MRLNLITDQVQSIIDQAIKEELTASHFYRHIANHMQRIGFFGAAKFFQGESADELVHYQKHVDYLNDRGDIATTPPIQEINIDVGSLEDAIFKAYKIETQLELKYRDWYKTLLDIDVTTAGFFLEFLEIQRKSIGEYGDLISLVNLAEGNPSALLLIDQKMGS